MNENDFDSSHTNVFQDLTDLVLKSDANTVEKCIILLKQNWKRDRLRRKNRVWEQECAARSTLPETRHRGILVKPFASSTSGGYENEASDSQHKTSTSSPNVSPPHPAIPAASRSSALSSRSTPDKRISQIMLDKRLNELLNTEQDFIDSLIELHVKLTQFRNRIVTVSTISGDNNSVRKRDVVKNVIRSGVASVLGILPLGKSSADPYVRSSSCDDNRLLSSDSIRERIRQWCPVVDWDEVVVLELMESVGELIKEHQGLLDRFLKAQGDIDGKSLPEVFLKFADIVGGHHLSYHKAAERGLLMVQLRDPDNLRDWHNLFVKPTQRILRYQLFVDELKRDATAAGRSKEGDAFDAAGLRFREALRQMNDDTSSFVKDCKQTVNVILRNSPEASPAVTFMLNAQQRVLLHFDAMQVVARSRLRGGEQHSLAGRQLLVFEDSHGQRCLVMVNQEPALAFLEAVRFSDLNTTNSGELRQCPAGALEQIRRRQHRAEAAGQPRLGAFEIDGRFYVAEEPAVGDLLRLLACGSP